jgi:hypothetical protein
MIWYTREASVAIYVANLPFIYPLLRDNFLAVRASVNRSRPEPVSRSSDELTSVEVPRSRERSMNAHDESVRGT